MKTNAVNGIQECRNSTKRNTAYDDERKGSIIDELVGNTNSLFFPSSFSNLELI